jgi:hypothetical protein
MDNLIYTRFDTQLFIYFINVGLTLGSPHVLLSPPLVDLLRFLLGSRYPPFQL